MNRPEGGRRFDSGAWWTLVLTLLLMALAVGSTVYRFTLPTDGWLASEPEDFNLTGLIYHQNVMGVYSGLQPGDHLVAVEGIPHTNIEPTNYWFLSENWQAGNTVRYTVLRGEEELDLDVPLTNWKISRYFQDGGNTTANVIFYLGVFTFLATGFLAFWRRPDIPAARALWVLSAVAFASLPTELNLGRMTDVVNPLATISVGFLFIATFTILIPPALIRFALVFPEPKPTLQRRPWIAHLPFVVGLIGVGATLFGFFLFSWLWVAASVLITLIILTHNAFTMQGAVSRAQVRWVIGGMIAGLAMLLSNYIWIFGGFTGPVVDFLTSLSGFGVGIIGIALGIAVLRYRLFDIDVIIRKTMVYAVLTGLLALVYFGSVVILQALFESITGESFPIVIVISTLLIAALFSPLRRRVQTSIDRRFFRQKYDAQRVLAQFAQTARDEVDLETLTAELVRVTRETVQPESVNIWLKR